MHETVSAAEKEWEKALGELSFLQLINLFFRAPELSASGGKSCSPCLCYFLFGFSQLCLFPSEANLSLEEVGGNNSSCSAAFHWLKICSLECTIPIVRIPGNVLSSLNGVRNWLKLLVLHWKHIEWYQVISSLFNLFGEYKLLVVLMVRHWATWLMASQA